MSHLKAQLHRSIPSARAFDAPARKPITLHLNSQQPSKRRCICASSSLQAQQTTAIAPGEVRQPTTAAASPADLHADVLIELHNVHKSFGKKQILRGTNIKVRRGEAVGIIGGSGTGKSTTLRLMAGLLMPDKGEVLIKGQVRKGLLSDDPELAQQLKVGMVFQNGALFDSLTVGENVGFMLYEHTQLPEERVKELVAKSLAAVGLSGVEDLFPGELSGGMKKRVALARAIIADDAKEGQDQVIMYDEPTAGLDPVASTVVEDLIRSMQSTRAKSQSNGGANSSPTGAALPSTGIASYIVVTHQHSTIRRAVDRIIFLHEGKVVWEGTTAEFDSTSEPIVRQFAQGTLDGPIKYT